MCLWRVFRFVGGGAPSDLGAVAKSLGFWETLGLEVKEK